MELAEKISKALGLLFINQNESEGNVCFANSDEIRSEFKETFNSIDLLNYQFAILHFEKYRQDLTVDLIPKERKIFWELVEVGSLANKFKNK